MSAETIGSAAVDADAAPLDLLLTDAALGVLNRVNPGGSGLRLAAALAARPGLVAGKTRNLLGELARIAAGTSQVQPSRRDRRFADPGWAGNPLLHRAMQAYLAAAQTAEGVVAEAGLDEADAERVGFVLTNLIDALAPSNNPLLNPAAVKAAIDTGGKSALAGLRHFATDMALAPRVPSMVEPDACNPPVTGDVFVIFQGGKYGSARIHGTITGAAAGEVATLYDQRFPYTTAAKPVSSIVLSVTSPRTTYSFTVRPTLATRYQVKVFARKSVPTPLAASPRQNLYVMNNGWTTGGKTCGGPACRETLHLFTVLPSTALRVEMSKPFYPYFGINLSTTGTPPPPRWLYLNAGHASVSGARRISAGEYERTLTFSFTVGNDGSDWAWTVCVKDTVSRDGLGLPGSHGCGAGRVLRTVSYLG